MDPTRCPTCSYQSHKVSNLKRHILGHEDVVDKTRQIFKSSDGFYWCRLHQEKMRFTSLYTIRTHYFFIHRGEDYDHLKVNNVLRQIISNPKQLKQTSLASYKNQREIMQKHLAPSMSSDEISRYLEERNPDFEKSI